MNGAASFARTFSRNFLCSGLAGFRSPRPPFLFASFCAIFFFLPSACFLAADFSLSTFLLACFRFSSDHDGLFWGM